MFGKASIVANTLKAGVVIVALSVLAANWLSSGVDRPALSRLAADPGAEPTITGSLRERAAQTRIDPCAAPAKR